MSTNPLHGWQVPGWTETLHSGVTVRQTGPITSVVYASRSHQRSSTIRRSIYARRRTYIHAAIVPSYSSSSFSLCRYVTGTGSTARCLRMIIKMLPTKGLRAASRIIDRFTIEDARSSYKTFITNSRRNDRRQQDPIRTSQLYPQLFISRALIRVLIFFLSDSLSLAKSALIDSHRSLDLIDLIVDSIVKRYNY